MQTQSNLLLQYFCNKIKYWDCKNIAISILDEHCNLLQSQHNSFHPCLSEYLALKTTVEEAPGMCLLIKYIGVPINVPINIHSDSESVLKSAANPGNELKRKHAAISYNLVRDNIATNIISSWKIDTKLNPAEPMTKSLSRIHLHSHITRL